MDRRHYDVTDKAIGRGAGQKREEFAQFLSMLEGISPEVIVEIGVCSGGATWAFTQYAPTVIGIDPEPKLSGAVDAKILTGGSQDPRILEKLVAELDGRPIDCLFIDGDHLYAGAMADYRVYRKMVRPGGIIALHDIRTVDNPWVDIKRVWSEVRDDTAIEIIDEHGGRQWGDNWGGIGVLTCG